MGREFSLETIPPFMHASELGMGVGSGAGPSVSQVPLSTTLCVCVCFEATVILNMKIKSKFALQMVN